MFWDGGSPRLGTPEMGRLTIGRQHQQREIRVLNDIRYRDSGRWHLWPVDGLRAGAPRPLGPGDRQIRQRPSSHIVDRRFPKHPDCL